MSYKYTEFPAPWEIKIAALQAKPLPIAGNYESGAPPNARGFKSGVGDKETPWLARVHQMRAKSVGERISDGR